MIQQGRVADVRFGAALQESTSSGTPVGTATSADPLLCPLCGGQIRLIAFIEQPEVSENILTRLGLWLANALSPPAGYPLPFSLQRVVAA